MSLMKTRFIPIPSRGSISSQDENSFRENLVSDIRILYEKLDTISALQNSMLLLTKQNNDVLQQRIDEARIRGKIQDYGDGEYAYINSFHGGNDLYIQDAEAATNCRVDTQFGMVYLPINGISSLLHAFNTDETRLLTDASVEIETTWDSTDYSYGATVTQNDSTQMLNGDNESSWFCRFALPLHSDVNSVRCRVTITLPNYGLDSANIFYMKPGIVCNQKVISFAVSGSLEGGSYTTLLENTELGFGKQLILPPYKTSKVQIVLEQNAWVEENGKKVFYIGLQEVGIHFAEFDKTNWTSGTANKIVLKVTAPDGYELDGVSNIVTTPNIFEETTYGSRNIRIRIFPNAYSGSPVLDTSTTNTLSANFVSSVTTAYIEIQMRYNVTITSGCPFDANSSPWLDDIGVVFRIS